MKPRYKLLNNGQIVEVTCTDATSISLGMHPADIKAALEKKGYTQTQVAAMAKRRTGHAHKSAVSRVVAGDLKSASLAQLISGLIGLPVNQIWPGKYPQLNYLDKASPTKASAAQTKAELQQLNARRGSGRRVAV